MKMTIIKLAGIEKKIANKEILKEISFEVYENEILGVFGPSGCGKTTILRIIAGLEKQDNGTVFLRGKEVSSKNMFVLPENRNISMIFQDLALWPHMTVDEHLKFVLENKKNEINNLLKSFKLEKYKNLLPENLSGGEKQRLAIARALAQKPDILLLDEPLSSLDIKLKKDILNILIKLKKENNLTMIYVSHDIYDTMKICGRLILMKDGSITKIGKPSRLLKEFDLKIPKLK